MMGLARLAVTTERLNLDALIKCVHDAPISDGSEGTGAVASFLGLVRESNLGRRVVKLKYEAYEPLALRAFERIDNEIVERWPTAQLALHHRIGVLTIGEVSVAIVVAAPHRADAFAASRYAIARVKQIAPIWKREFFKDGDVWIEGATTDPDDAAAREEAFRRACV